jgi:6-phosphogluconolactonase
MTGDLLTMLGHFKGSVRTWRKLGLALLWCVGMASATAAVPCNPSELVYLGTDGVGIQAVRFDACAGTLTLLKQAADARKSRWLAKHPRLPVLYAAAESTDGDGRVLAYTVDGRTGGLAWLGEAAAGGAGTTHLWLDASSMTLLAANFGAGSVSSIALSPDGKPGALVSTIKATGSGPHRRQASPHAHGVTIDPSGRYALVADMGADRVFVYGFERTTRALVPDDAAAPRSFQAPAGSGPRRAVFSASGRNVYVLSELTAEITALRWNASLGRLEPLQTLALSSPDFVGTRSASELALSADGRFLYVGNRGENQLLVYRVDTDSGELAPVQRLPSGGEAPWAFDIHPSGQWMLVANYRSNRISLMRIDTASGRLSDTGIALESPAPVSVLFVN